MHSMEIILQIGNLDFSWARGVRDNLLMMLDSSREPQLPVSHVITRVSRQLIHFQPFCTCATILFFTFYAVVS